ncbi:hypothetical protein ACLB2K_067286 [Fragaria x ananassa]
MSCPALQCLPEGFGHLNSLQTLKIRDCPALQFLPEGFGHLKSRQTMKITNCPALLCLPGRPQLGMSPKQNTGQEIAEFLRIMLHLDMKDGRLQQAFATSVASRHRMSAILLVNLQSADGTHSFLD